MKRALSLILLLAVTLSSADAVARKKGGKKEADLSLNREMFKNLTAPYIGKVIYVDFWGTWCPGCIQQFGYMEEIKKGLEGEDVVYMYFASNSPTDKAEEMILKHGLVGENVVHYNLLDFQHKMIEQLFDIRHYPRFLIIDKDGNVADDNAPMPRDGQKTVEAIRKYL